MINYKENDVSLDNVLLLSRKLGLVNPQIKYIDGWRLYGYGKDEDGFPLVWKIVEELGIADSFGDWDFHSINIDLIKEKYDFTSNSN